MVKTEPLAIWNARLAVVTRSRQLLARLDSLTNEPLQEDTTDHPERDNLRDAINNYANVCRREGFDS